MHIEQKVNTIYGDVLATFTDGHHVHVYSNTLDFKNRTWYLSGHLELQNENWQWMSSPVVKELLPEKFFPEKDAPPTYKKNILDIILKAMIDIITSHPEIIQKAVRRKAYQDLSSARNKMKKLTLEIEQARNHMLECAMIYSEVSPTTCNDHWHCVPEISPHDCSKLNQVRSKPCPTCGDVSDEV